MTDSTVEPASPLRVPLTLVLTFLAPPLALVSWIFLSGGRRASYLQSFWVRAGAAVVAVSALPLVAIGLAAAIGLWPDPDPNPIGLGLLFVAGGVLGSIMVLIGVLAVGARGR